MNYTIATLLDIVPPDQPIIISSMYEDNMTMFRGECKDVYRAAYYKHHAETLILSVTARRGYLIIYV